MEENYSINEILNAVNELQNFKREKKINLGAINKKNMIAKSDIPPNTLRLIEDAENTIKSKLKSE
tara:strand:- start:98 stop:292 length:195 start_codon:yes stop_codon:yes gene_type:complete